MKYREHDVNELKIPAVTNKQKYKKRLPRGPAQQLEDYVWNNTPSKSEFVPSLY